MNSTERQAERLRRESVALREASQDAAGKRLFSVAYYLAEASALVAQALACVELSAEPEG